MEHLRPTVEPNHLDHVMRTVGATVLGLEFPSYEGPDDEIAGGFTWAGLVQITGPFSGGVVIRCGTPAAEAMARGLLTETGALADDVLEATLSELAQLLAGSVAPFLGEKVTLSPARSMQGAVVARMGESADVVARTLLTVHNEAVEVVVFRV